MTSLIKKDINEKKIYKHFVKNKDFTNNDSNLERLHLHSLQNNLNNIIETTKQKYFAKIVNKLSEKSSLNSPYFS